MADNTDDLWAAPTDQPRQPPPPGPTGGAVPPPPPPTPPAQFGPAQASPQYAAPPAQFGPAQASPQYATPPAPAPGNDRSNWLGLVALILPLVGLALPGIVFGHLALGANRKGTANNRPIALAGTIVSYAVTVLGAIGIGIFAILAAAESNAGSDAEGQPAVEDVVDDLFNGGDGDGSGGSASDDWDTGSFSVDEADQYLELYYSGPLSPGTCLGMSTSLTADLEAVDCAETHVAELFYSVPASEFAPGEVLNSEDVQARISERCYDEFEGYVGTEYFDSDYFHWYFIATDDAVTDEGDSYVCLVSLDFTPLPEVIQGSGS